MILFQEDALEDLERIFRFNFERDAASAPAHIAAIREAVEILERHPQIGRRIGPASSLRELVVSYGRTGYLALYEYVPTLRFIRVVAIRHQREAGYRDGE